MKNQSSILKGTLLAGTLVGAGALTANSTSLFEYTDLGSGSEIRAELVTNSSIDLVSVNELKCGEGKCGESKGDAKKGDAKKDDSKASELFQIDDLDKLEMETKKFLETLSIKRVLLGERSKIS